jgi:phosphoribosylformylglycinamidine synthase
MSRFLARVTVMLKPLVNDPQGLAVRDGLQSLGFEGVEAVRVGKRLELTLEASDPAEAGRRVRAMCEQLLANPVIEDFRVDLADAPLDAAPAGAATA